MSIENKGPGGVPNSYGVRETISRTTYQTDKTYQDVFGSGGVAVTSSVNPLTGEVEFSGGAAGLAAPVARPVVIDTDWWTDVDDAVAMRCALWAERAGYIDIMGVTVSASHASVPASLDAFLVNEGRRGLPIGIDTAATDYGGALTYQAAMARARHDVQGPSTVESAVNLLRRACVQALEGGYKLDIIAIGYPNNLAGLLQSTADDVSSLSGLQLAQSAVRHVWCMAGDYPANIPRSENNFTRNARSRTAGAYFVENWPTEITFVGYTAPNTVLTGGNLATALPGDMLTVAMDDHGSAAGRQSWDPMTVMLAAIGDLDSAGYTAVYGTNSVNSSDGNTWTNSAAGRHRYVVKAWPDAAYQNQINTLLTKAGWPQRKVGKRQLPAYDRGLSAYGAESLKAWFHADDLTDLSDGDAIQHWASRVGNLHLRNTGTSERPLYRAAQYGRKALDFNAAAARLISDAMDCPDEITVYVKVAWATLPTGTQAVIAQDEGAGGSIYGRGWHLKPSNATTTQAVWFSGTSGVTDNQASTMVIGTWHVMALRLTAGEIQAFFDGNGTAPTAIASPNKLTLPLSLGARNFTGALAETFRGFIHEARIYSVAHTSDQIAAVVADMA